MIISAFLFFISSFLAFYIPGQVLIRKLHLNLFQETVISTVVGISLLAWQGFVFGFLNVRWATYIYLAIFLFFWIKNENYKNLKFKKNKFKPDFLIILIIFLGVLVQSSIVWGTGLPNTKGISFCCGDTSADIYHLGLTYSTTQHFPPYESEMANTVVANYHYLSNLTVGELIRIFRLPLEDTEFRLMAPLISLLFGLLAISISQLLSFPKLFTRLLLFLLYLSGDALFLIQMVFSRSINFTFGPLENGSAFLENPPRAFAIVVFLAGFFLLIKFAKTKNVYIGFLIALLFASSIGFKVYIGIFALSGLFFLSIYHLPKKQFAYALLFSLTFFLSLIIYLPVNAGSGGLYFIGLWRFEEFGIQPLSGLTNMVLALPIYKQHNNITHIIFVEITLFVLFIFGEFGTKLIGLFQTKKGLKFFPKDLNIFLICALALNLIVGLFFQQNAGGSNSFNFLVSVYIFSSFYAASTCYLLVKKINPPLKYLFLIFLLVLNLPRIIFAMKTNYENMKDTYTVSNAEIEAMNFLANKTTEDSIIMSNYTPYLNYIAKRQIFLNNYGILESHTIDTSKRKKVVKTVLSNNDESTVKKLLSENKISYLYLSQSQPFATENKFNRVFSNSDIKIFKAK